MNKDLQDKLQQLAATPEIIKKMTELNKDGDVTSAKSSISGRRRA